MTTMDITSISLTDIENIALKSKNDGYRLVVITCTAISSNEFNLTYSFSSKNNENIHYRVTVNDTDQIPSINSYFKGSYVYENEIHDLYGLTFTGLVIDFKGTFIQTSIPYPFKKDNTLKSPKITKNQVNTMEKHNVN
ncbi:MAG TPA: NADH-quinone oxidoreductase subunit C [Methanocorpusculum sp.]|nr:NADH-quinone oxidoreductase subunit C [Methanocorpusculum sp.]